MSTKSDINERQHTHYDVLQLNRQESSRLCKDDIKAAYRRALLVHHPDKASNAELKTSLKNPPRNTQTPRYSIDDIVIAHEVLSDPAQRAEYDRTLARSDKLSRTIENGDKRTHIGVESFDLEDLAYDENKNIWTKSCRCDDEQGYVLTESDLEEESHDGEVYVGCRGCSLFIKVQFAVEVA